ncbi:MAG TPA: response regulator [Pyrinomonadaceae bacterium]|nr:response regulator [Pyrinomonadaceae bacterium]
MMLQENPPLPESNTATRGVESSDGIRVLLAEDDRALRRFLEVILERAGYKVIPVADGLEAMKVALSMPIDIVVTDAMMPNLSGHEFCRFLRNSQTLSHLPVILLSALEQKEGNQNTDQVDAFLSKPVSAESLVECIERLLARKSGERMHN